MHLTGFLTFLNLKKMKMTSSFCTILRLAARHCISAPPNATLHDTTRHAATLKVRLRHDDVCCCTAHYTALHHTPLHYNAPPCSTLHRTATPCITRTALHAALQHAALCGGVWLGGVQYSVVWFGGGMVRYGVFSRSAVQWRSVV